MYAQILYEQIILTNYDCENKLKKDSRLHHRALVADWI
jgi:hypothetical protein